MSVQAPADLGFLLNEATRCLRLRLAGALTGVGLTPPQAAVLMAVGRSPGGRLTPRAIAAAIGSDQATTSGLLDRLTRGGWLVSEPHPEDRRSHLLGLTAKASDTLPVVLRTADAVSSAATACLSGAEVATLRGLLHRLCEAAGSAKTTCKAGG
jgi:DNA-binding MarR family transcriptional regulator